MTTNTPSLSERLGTFRGLLLLNMFLLLVLGAVTFGAHVQAQSRSRGEYTMVAGGVNGTDADAVFVVDTINQEMLSVYYDYNSKTIQGLGYRNLSADAGTHTRAGQARTSK